MKEPIGLVIYVIFYTYLVFDLFGFLRLVEMLQYSCKNFKRW